MMSAVARSIRCRCGALKPRIAAYVRMTLFWSAVVVVAYVGMYAMLIRSLWVGK